MTKESIGTRIQRLSQTFDEIYHERMANPESEMLHKILSHVKPEDSMRQYTI